MPRAMTSKGESGVIQVMMLGGFSITVGQSTISDSDARTHQLWHLIEYLIAFRHKPIGLDELSEALWPDGNVENPAGALKNLIYRIRTAFASQNLPYAREMVVFTGDGYRWNNSLPCVVDAEEFEKRYKRLAADGDLDPGEQLGLYMEAIDLYKGDFLPRASYESWVLPLSSYYQSLYFKCVYAVVDLLSAREQFEQVEGICKRALEVDPFEEPAHRHLILSLIRQGKRVEAMAHYSASTDLFFRELGVNPSPAMRSLYRDIVRTIHDVEIDINIIKEDLRESQSEPGAFYCAYEVFKNLYRLEARSAARTGQSVYLCLVTLEGASGGALDLKEQNRFMDALYLMIQQSLRRGDVFSRFSPSQYVLMLASLTYENCAMVMERIAKRFKQQNRGKGAAIFYNVQPLDPVDFQD